MNAVERIIQRAQEGLDFTVAITLGVAIGLCAFSLAVLILGAMLSACVMDATDTCLASLKSTVIGLYPR